MRKTSNRQIQYNVENFDKIHASSASVLDWLPTYSIEVRTGGLDRMVLSVGFMYDV